MRKQLFLSTAVALFFALFASKIEAQNKNAFYVEVLGSGLTFSANYDFNFTNTDTWGARVGIGYVGGVNGEGDGGVITVPLVARKLLGKEGKYFEVGAGITYVGGTGEIGDDELSDIIGTLSFQYRRQPENGGFMWKIGLTPIIAEGIFYPWWPGLSIGYTW